MKTLNQSSLKERLKEKMDSDRQQTEALMNEQLNKLVASLKKSASVELTSTKKSMGLKFQTLRTEIKTEIDQTEKAMDLSDIRKKAHSLQKILIKTWIAPLIVGLCFCIGISAGIWGLMQYQSSRIKNLSIEIQEQKQALKQFKTQTWGLTLLENKNGKFILLPQGMTVNPEFSVGKKEALKLIRR